MSKLVFAILIVSLMIVLTASCDNVETNRAFKEMSDETIVEKDGLKVAPEVKGIVDELSESAGSKTKSIYTLAEVDAAPFFGQKCKNLEDLDKCNQRNIVSFIKDNIDLPTQTESGNYSGLEYVKVIIKEDGTMSDLKYFSTKKANCSWCQETAVDVVGKMNNWEPAMKNGKPVSVEVTIPIKFLS